MADLLVHLEAVNAEMQARMDVEPGLICLMFHTDIDVWNQAGVYTAEDFEAAMQAEYERNKRKDDMYWWLDCEDENLSLADRNYFDRLAWEEEQARDAAAYEAEYLAWEEAQEMKKWGVDTLLMIPDHYEQMAIRAGFMEY